MTLAYVGSLSTRADMTLDANTAITPGPGDAAIVNSRRQWAFYGTNTRFGTDLGRGNYNALQAKRERRYKNGLQMLAAYTGPRRWITVLMPGTGHPTKLLRCQCRLWAIRLGPPGYFLLEATYQLPFGKGRLWLQNGIPAYILGGWQLNAIGRAQSGTPVLLQATGDPANIGNTQYNYDRPNVVGNAAVSHPSSAQWFNQSAFQQPVDAFGNAPRGCFATPIIKTRTCLYSKIFRSANR